jgi:phage terminase small subunit
MATRAPRNGVTGELTIDSNGAQAAIRAGYSPRTANEQAVDLLANPSVKAAVTAGRAAIAERNSITQDRIRQELAKVAFSDMGALYGNDGTLRPIHEMDANVRAGLAGIETGEIKAGKGNSAQVIGLVRKVKRWDKVRALELLGKDLGMFQDVLTERRLAELEKAFAGQGIDVENPQPLNGHASRINRNG